MFPVSGGEQRSDFRERELGKWMPQRPSFLFSKLQLAGRSGRRRTPLRLQGRVAGGAANPGLTPDAPTMFLLISSNLLPRLGKFRVLNFFLPSTGLSETYETH